MNKKMLAKLKQTGLLYATGIVFNRIVPAWLFRYRRQTIYQLKLPDAHSLPQNEIQIGWCACEADFKACEAVTLSSRSYQEHGGEFICQQAKLGEEVVGAFWGAPRFFDETDLGVRIVMDSTQRWLFSARVAKEARRQGVFSALLTGILQSLEEDNLVGLVAVNPVNRGSVLAHKKFVQRKLGTLTACRFLGVTICRVSDGLQSDRSFAVGSKPVEVRV